MGKVFCFGELLLRMSPSLGGKWIQDSSIPVYIGGAELNVAMALARWNIPAKYFTALPDNYLSEEIKNELTTKGIDTSAIHFSGDRIGIYFLPQGTDLKNAAVIYDRAASSFAELKPGMVDWNEAFNNCSWFHWSAISPALNENTAAVCKEAIEAAVANGLAISVDLNYRSKLWQYGKKPSQVMPDLVKYCDVIMGNIWAAEQLLGIRSPLKDSSEKTMEELIDAAVQSMKAIHLTYPRVQTMAYTFRLQKEYFGDLKNGNELTVSEKLSLDNVVDKVGSGDCFMGGLIYGMYHNHQPQQIINFAASAAVGKMAEKGDATGQTIEIILQRVNKEWSEAKP